jgi:hypothetical protein
MALEIRELTIRAVVNERPAQPEMQSEVDEKPCGEDQDGGNKVNQKQMLEMAMDQMVKLLKNKDER